jgi:hypothetical protein
MPYCQTLKQKIEEIKEKAKILENLLNKNIKIQKMKNSRK